ncbi:MAG: MmcQ/YjbR family DNA-binding protein [Anaerolineaceae bacterium]|nr:MmcQ/YjbR family DNA-binding protein [Anaerolineaceae bacterium]
MLSREDLRRACLSRQGAYEDFPFGPEAAVYKVGGKMFALIPVVADPPSISLKCDPAWAEILRQTYPAVTPGYHFNKKHWNTILADASIPDDEIEEMVVHSYGLVLKSLPKKLREELGG